MGIFLDKARYRIYTYIVEKCQKIISYLVNLEFDLNEEMTKLRNRIPEYDAAHKIKLAEWLKRGLD